MTTIELLERLEETNLPAYGCTTCADLFAVCSNCGRIMYDGWVLDEGSEHACSEECFVALKDEDYYNELQHANPWDCDNDYWTTWEAAEDSLFQPLLDAMSKYAIWNKEQELPEDVAKLADEFFTALTDGHDPSVLEDLSTVQANLQQAKDALHEAVWKVHIRDWNDPCTVGALYEELESICERLDAVTAERVEDDFRSALRMNQEEA